MSNPNRIEALVTRVQQAFLDRPSLQLTLPQAQMRFGIGRVTCEAVMEMMVETGVLAKTSSGAYIRKQPRRLSLVHRAA